MSCVISASPDARVLDVSYLGRHLHLSESVLERLLFLLTNLVRSKKSIFLMGCVNWMIGLSSTVRHYPVSQLDRYLHSCGLVLKHFPGMLMTTSLMRVLGFVVLAVSKKSAFLMVCLSCVIGVSTARSRLRIKFITFGPSSSLEQIGTEAFCGTAFATSQG